MSLVTKLVCDWPGCESTKADIVWWESSSDGEGPWNKTKDGRHWCRKHDRDDITKLIEDEEDPALQLVLPERKCPRARSRSGRTGQRATLHGAHKWWAGEYLPVGDLGEWAWCPGYEERADG